ncbi:murein transglycosylase A [Vibrio sp. RC27]
MSLRCSIHYNANLELTVKKAISLVAMTVLLAACTQPTERAQQYLDGTMESGLNQRNSIESNVPRDYSEFSKQSELVIEQSPRYEETFQPLYEQLNQWVMASGDPKQLSQFGIQSAQLGGADTKGNVLFTGYFSPVIELRHQADDIFRYPVYAKPECIEECPTRAQINQGALNGLGLELGYAANQIDPFIMEVQGSGFVHFEDDTLEYFAYAGKNDHPYVSIGKILIERDQVPREKMSLKAIKEWVLEQDEATVRELLEQNTSYVFFEPKDAAPVTGSAGVPLLPMASVAGDKRLFPMGTPILAEVPLLNADGSWSGAHQLRLLIVLDTGGAVTDGHLDLYHGIGPRAGIEAGHYRHFGRVWKLGLEGSATQLPWVIPPEKLD